MLRTTTLPTTCPEQDACSPPSITRALLSPAPRTALRRWRWYIAAAALLCGHTQRSAAQDPQQPYLGVTPDSMVLSDQTPVAPLTLTNLEDSPREVWLAPECPAGDYAMTNAQMFYDWLAPLDPLTAAWRNESECAITWITGYPRYLTLAPHERRIIPIHITPPKTLQNGRYGARIIWAIGLPDEIVHYEVAITYVRGPWHRRHWQPTPPTGPGSAVIQATPAAVVLDDSTHAATFTLYNRAARPTEVWLSVDCPWFTANFVSYPLSHQYEAAWHGRSPNASLLISGFPQHLVLAPHERRTLPIQFSHGPTPIVDVVGNTYARVVYAEAPVLLVSPKGDTTFTTPSGAINVVVRTVSRNTDNQLVWPSLTLSQPRIHVGDDLQHVVCDTVRQPGRGFVATIHAEVDDANGRPVTPVPSVNSRGGSPPPGWGLDTTVAVWQVQQSEVMQLDDNRRKAPAPVCLALPHLAPGHYQVMLSAYQLQDVARQHPVQATVPLDIQ